MRVASISIDVSISLSHTYIYISKFVRFASYKGGGMNDYEEGRSTGNERNTRNRLSARFFTAPPPLPSRYQRLTFLALPSRVHVRFHPLTRGTTVAASNTIENLAGLLRKIATKSITDANFSSSVRQFSIKLYKFFVREGALVE